MVSSPVVKIYVGPGAVCFSLPKDLLSHYSTFFRAAIEHGFKEAEEGVFKLPEDEPEHFAVFREYIYNGTAVKFEPKADADVKAKLTSIFNFVLFADKYDMLNLIPEPSVIKGIIEKLENYNVNGWLFVYIHNAIGMDLLVNCLTVLRQDHALYDFLAQQFLVYTATMPNNGGQTDSVGVAKSYIETVPQLAQRVTHLLCFGKGQKLESGELRVSLPTQEEIQEGNKAHR